MLNATATIASDGVLTLTMPAGELMHLTISNPGDGAYRFVLDPGGGETIDLAADDAGLATEGSGTTDFQAWGITGLKILVESDSLIQVTGSHVPTSIVVGAGSPWITLGAGGETGGLGAVAAPVAVTSTAAGDASSRPSLDLLDAGSDRETTYTVTSDAIAATGGFGGVAYADMRQIRVTAGRGPAHFDVRSTSSALTMLSGGESVQTDFHVDATGPAGGDPVLAFINGPALQLVGGSGGASTFNVQRAPAPVWILTATRFDSVVLGRDGSTAGLTHEVSISPASPAPGTWGATIIVDGSAGTAPADVRLTSAGAYLGSSALVGALGADAWVRIAGDFSGDLHYSAPQGLANSMTVDVAAIAPSDDGATWFNYHGGGGPGSRLTLLGRPEGSTFVSQRYFATSADSGFTNIWSSDGGDFGLITVNYTGVADVVDLVSADIYGFEYWGGAEDAAVTIRDGATMRDAQTLQFVSRAEDPAFAPLSIANKAYVGTYTNGERVSPTLVVDYRSEAPVAGLNVLVLDDESEKGVVAAPPGATLSILPRFEIPYILEPFPTEPIPTEPNETPPVEPPIPSTPMQEPTPVTPSTGSESETAGGPVVPTSGPTVGAERLARFGRALRTGPGGAAAMSRFARLAEARAARFAALRAGRLERLERLQALRAARIG